MAGPRIPNAPREYSQMSVQQILASIQFGLDELYRRGVFNETQTTVGSAGAASALPSNPDGYVKVVVAGEEKVIPFYAPS